MKHDSNQKVYETTVDLNTQIKNFMEKDKILNKDEFKYTGSVPFIILLAIISLPIQGFVFMKLIGWFVTPSFHITINLVQSIGTILIIGLITPTKNRGVIDNEKIFSIFIETISKYLITLGIGYLITLFI